VCGIVGGFMDKDKVGSKLSKYWEKLAHRGVHSYGVIVIGRDKMYAIKSLEKKQTLKSLKKRLKELDGDEVFVIAHNRWATTGGTISSKTAHPIISGSWWIIHNGTKRALSTLTGISHDTRAIARLLNTMDLRRYKEFGKLILNGTGVVFGIHIDERALFFHRDISRTLYFNPELKIFASEPVENGEWILIPPIDSLVAFDGDNYVESLKEFIEDELFRINEADEDRVINVDTFHKGICPICRKMRVTDIISGRCYNCIIKIRKNPELLKKGRKSSVCNYGSSSYYGKYNINF